MIGVLYEVPKAGGKLIRATVTTYKGSQPYLDLREWYTDKAGNLQPGKGCTLPLDGISSLHNALGRWLASNFK